MSENTFISILKANRLMRSDEEVTAFEKALFELARNTQKEDLPELHLVLDDQCQHQEVMFSLIHFLESFEVEVKVVVWIFRQFGDHNMTVGARSPGPYNVWSILFESDAPKKALHLRTLSII